MVRKGGGGQYEDLLFLKRVANPAKDRRVGGFGWGGQESSRLERKRSAPKRMLGDQEKKRERRKRGNTKEEGGL